MQQQGVERREEGREGKVRRVRKYAAARCREEGRRERGG